MEPAQWYANLPSFLASASALITDPSGAAVLAVKPNYRNHWNVPGGIMEAGEPPHLCCAREVAEELGLELAVGRLLVVDWVPPTEQRKAWFGFLFDGGVLEDPSRISLQSEELEEFTFIAHADLRTRLTANTADRVEAALLARDSGGVAYLHDGALVQHASSGAPRFP
ncbi:NUDIX domain-containing protein [Actinoplanes sp. ATCC 53533]|nr:NUDIX domain-containing protein [Actinoplanes sp. ATCC 53533]